MSTLAPNKPHGRHAEASRRQTAQSERRRRDRGHLQSRAFDPVGSKGQDDTFDHQNERYRGREVLHLPSRTGPACVQGFGASARDVPEPLADPKKRKNSLSGERTKVVSPLASERR